MKFTKIEEYRKAHEGVSRQQEVIQRERNSALETLQALKADYSAVLTKSIQTGEDATTALDKLSDSIAAAERNFQRKELAVTVSAGTRPNILSDEVMQEWNSSYIPQYHNEVLNPLLGTLEKARDDYYKAHIAYQSAVQALENERMSVVYTLDPNGGLINRYVYKLRGADRLSMESSYVIKTDDIKKLSTGVLPLNANVKRGV
ncbi:MAG: hypothetical protein K6T85_12560 [Gorillibacterium sp.]|nr:hypothetical protein [Gorillibacterium sp.]